MWISVVSVLRIIPSAVLKLEIAMKTECIDYSATPSGYLTQVKSSLIVAL